MKLPIHYKITLFFIIIIAAILLSIYFYLNNTLLEYSFRRIRTNLRNQLSFCKIYLEEDSISKTKSYDLDKVANKMSQNLKLRITIINIDGTVLGDSELEGDKLFNVENHLYRPEVQQALKNGFGQSRRFSTTIKKEMLYVAQPYGKDKIHGIIRLSIPLLEIELISSSLRKTLLVSIIFAFIFASIISFLISIIVYKPIREISSATKDIAHGNYSKKISIESEDEIGDLAKTFNFMTQQIKERMDEVNEGKSRLEAVFLSMFEGVMIVDKTGSIMLVNETLKKSLDINENPIDKKPIEAIRNLDIQEITDKTLGSNYGLISKEITTLIPEEKVLLIHSTPIIKDNITEGAVLVFHDVTNLRKLEKIRQDFVANVSHELRTPIASIKGYSETLLEGAIDDKKNAKDFLRIILEDSNRLSSLIDDLLNLSKIESGKLKMEIKSYKLLPIAEAVIKNLEKELHKKSIKIEIDIPENLPKVLIDEIRIKQVFLNLIDNAIKYNYPDGKIRISAYDNKDGFIKIDITDTGIGIPEKDLPRLFERFYRVDKARSRELGGTGLGLSIVKHIVQAHNGNVSIQSIEEKGSTFSFTIPEV